MNQADRDAVMTDGKFDITKFNVQFDNLKQSTQTNIQNHEAERLAELNKQQPDDRKPFEQSIGEIAISLKDTWFDVLDDLVHFRLSRDILLQGHRLFYIGITIIMICLLFWLFDSFDYENAPIPGTITTQSNNVIGVIEIRHTYQQSLSGNDIPASEIMKPGAGTI